MVLLFFRGILMSWSSRRETAVGGSRLCSPADSTCIAVCSWDLNGFTAIQIVCCHACAMLFCYTIWLTVLHCKSMVELCASYSFHARVLLLGCHSDMVSVEIYIRSCGTGPYSILGDRLLLYYGWSRVTCFGRRREPRTSEQTTQDRNQVRLTHCSVL